MCAAAAFGLMARYVSPLVFWPPAVAALLLPPLLLLTSVILIFFLLRKQWRSALHPALVLCFAVPVLNYLLAWSSPAAVAADTPTLVVVTGNQRAFRSSDRETVDTTRVEEAVGSFGADILLLQEALPSRYRQSFIPTIRRAGKFADRHQQAGTTIATYANGLAPVSSHFVSPNEYNGFVVSDIETALGKIRIINAHLESNQISDMSEHISSQESIGDRTETFGKMLQGYGRASRARARQATEIRKAVEESPYPVVLGGDFNDVPSSYTYREMLSPRLRDAWSVAGSGLGPTFTGKLPGLRIDYFLVDTSLQVVNIERLAARWSDHRPVRLTVAR